jgi:hypothetical protein
MKRCQLLWLLLGGWGYVECTQASVSAVKWSGFVRLDSYLDTYQVVGDRGDILLLYPSPKDYDATGGNKNDFWEYQLSEIMSRFRCAYTGPVIRNFTPSATIEGDFYGSTADTTVAYRLRHAFIKLQSDTDTILIGRYWHPVRVDDCHGPVISCNDGAPIEIYARDPQIRWAHRHGKFELISAISMQSQGYRSNGPEGYKEEYLRRAIIPNLTLHLRRVSDKHTLGVGIDYKRLLPRLVNVINQSVSESVDSVSACAYWAWRLPCVSICTKCIYGQNIVDLSSVGGYAVGASGTTMIVGSVDNRSYIPLQTIHAWLDIAAFPDQSWVPGIFIGGVKNMGTLKSIYLNADGQPRDPWGNLTVYGRDPYYNIDYVFRVAPRLTWNVGAFNVGCELEYTRASFGNFNNKARVTHGTPTNVLRPLIVACYVF